MTRTEKFTVALFGLFAVLIVVPGVVLAVVSIFSTGAIYLSH